MITKGENREKCFYLKGIIETKTTLLGVVKGNYREERVLG